MVMKYPKEILYKISGKNLRRAPKNTIWVARCEETIPQRG